jgi:adenosylcobyric acid synthase
VVVLRLPRLSNFTDFDPLLVEGGVAVRFVDHPSAFGDPDLIVLPGTKSTVADLEWVRASGLLEVMTARRAAAVPPVVLGLCGGFQMLGRTIEDPDGIESLGPAVPGLGWLPLSTRFEAEKTTRLREGTGPGGVPVRGYEIRHGRSRAGEEWEQWLRLDGRDEIDEGNGWAEDIESACDASALVFGTSLHGLFEQDRFRGEFLRFVAAARGKSWHPSGASFAAAREQQIDRMADACAAYLDLDALWRLVDLAERLAVGVLADERLVAPRAGLRGKGGDTAKGADGCPPDVGGGRAHGARSMSMWCPRSPTRSMMMCMEANSHCPARQV